MSEDGSYEPVFEETAAPQGVYMAAPGAGNAGNRAAGNGPPPPDPFTTPINAEMPAAQMEQIRTTLAAEQARLREETDR